MPRLICYTKTNSTTPSLFSLHKDYFCYAKTISAMARLFFLKTNSALPRQILLCQVYLHYIETISAMPRLFPLWQDYFL